MQRSRAKRYWWLQFWTDVQIKSLSYYLDKLYTELGHMADEFTEWMISEAQKIEDDKEREEFFESYQIDSWYHEEVFPRLFLNSFHVTAYSLLETETYNIARQIGRKKNQQFDVSEIRGGNYLESASYYIKKLTGIDAKQFSSWHGLTDGQKLRNIIVHSNGKVIETRDIRLAKRCRVYDTKKKEVKITPDYCESFMKLLKTFFSEMYKQIKSGRVL